MNYKRIFITLILSLTLFVGMNRVSAEIGGIGGNTSGGGDANLGGSWDSGFKGIRIRFSGNDTNCWYDANWTDNKKWWDSNGKVDADYLYIFLGIPTTKNKNRKYEGIINLANKCLKKNVLESNIKYIYIVPYTKLEKKKYTLRTLINAYGFNDNIRSVYQSLANSATVGADIAGYKKVPGSCTYDGWYNKDHCGLSENIKIGYGITIIKVSDIQKAISEDGTLQITKIDATNSKKLQGATFQLCTGKGSGCSSKTTNKNGIVTFEKLKINKQYYFREKKAPDGYENTNKDWQGIKLTKDGEIKRISIKNSKTCASRLAAIKEKYRFDKSTNNTDAREELYKLYKDFPGNTKLLNFDNYADQGIDCKKMNNNNKTIKENNATKFACDESLNFSAAKNKIQYYWYLSNSNNTEISANKSTVKCKFDIKTIKSIIKNNVSVIAGTSIWKSNINDTVLEIEVKETCTGYNINDDAKKQIKKELENQNFDFKLSGNDEINKKFELKFEPKTSSVKEKNSGKEYEIDLTKTYIWIYGDNNTIYYNKKTGAAKLGKNFDTSNYTGPDYGFPTPITKDSGKIKFSITLPKNISDFFGLKSTISSTSCKYNTTVNNRRTCIPGTGDSGCPDNTPSDNGKLNLSFREIDAKNINKSFPGMDGSGRNVGNNWCYKIGKKTDCSNTNNLIKTIIENRNDSYNSKNQTALISLELSASDIKRIKDYNSGTSYDDYNLKCKNGKMCVSNFVTKILNNEYGRTTGSCKKDAGVNRKYCVGDSQ